MTRHNIRSETTGKVGLIAGGGQFPQLIAKAAKKRGIQVFALAHYGETDPALSEDVDDITWIKLGQLGQIIGALKKNGIEKALMAGTIKKTRMFAELRPDLKGLAVMSKLAILHDDDILRAVANELAKDGIDIVSSTIFLPELLAPSGWLTKKKASKVEKEDIKFGWKMAKELGRLDIGQCVVVRRKTVLAVEAIDGTNETITRGGRLAGENAVVVKVSKPNQDLRFDVPTIGLETIKTMAAVKASVLGIEAGKTLIFDKSEMIMYAEKNRITIVSR